MMTDVELAVRPRRDHHGLLILLLYQQLQKKKRKNLQFSQGL